MVSVLKPSRTTVAVLCLMAGLSLTFSSVRADTVTVTEGETAYFNITATPKLTGSGRYDNVPVRIWYDTDGGTAVEGKDYETAHSWAHNVQGFAGRAMTFAVKTFADDDVEGDETFNIRMRKIQVQVRSRWGQNFWRTTPSSSWNFSGVKTATIEDTTRPPQQQQPTYEQEKYGTGYTGQVWGE